MEGWAMTTAITQEALSFRKALSLPSMLKVVNKIFSGIKDPGATNRARKPLKDCLMSALAMFSLKYPSLLSFVEDHQENEIIAHNLKQLFGVNEVPSDTYMRERLDVLESKLLRAVYKKIFSQVQRGNELKTFLFLKKYYLTSLDGTGIFSSHEIYPLHLKMRTMANAGFENYL